METKQQSMQYLSLDMRQVLGVILYMTDSMLGAMYLTNIEPTYRL